MDASSISLQIDPLSVCCASGAAPSTTACRGHCWIPWETEIWLQDRTPGWSPNAAFRFLSFPFILPRTLDPRAIGNRDPTRSLSAQHSKTTTTTTVTSPPTPSAPGPTSAISRLQVCCPQPHLRPQSRPRKSKKTKALRAVSADAVDSPCAGLSGNAYRALGTEMWWRGRSGFCGRGRLCRRI